jgi:hypothetical protein
MVGHVTVITISNAHVKLQPVLLIRIRIRRILSCMVGHVTVITISNAHVKLQPVLLIRIRIRRIHMFLGLLDPDPVLKNIVNVPSKSNKQKN